MVGDGGGGTAVVGGGGGGTAVVGGGTGVVGGGPAVVGGGTGVVGGGPAVVGGGTSVVGGGPAVVGGGVAEMGVTEGVFVIGDDLGVFVLAWGNDGGDDGSWQGPQEFGCPAGFDVEPEPCGFG
ncbi:MAG TPA: hypothetical protein VK851_10555 [Anaerolineales bacterium]|nr:hypothetical protein [Anaerolineales bacterium]